jgi:hypothetical protein
MFSAGQVAITDPSGETTIHPEAGASNGVDTASGALSTGDIVGLSCQAGAALINSITSWACLGIQNRMQKNHMAALDAMAETKKQMQMEAIKSQSVKMQVVEEVTKNRTKVREEHARASAELKMAKAELAEQRATRKATKADVRKLDALFSRNEWFYGNPR